MTNTYSPLVTRFLSHLSFVFCFVSCQNEISSSSTDVETTHNETLPFTSDGEMKAFFDQKQSDQQVYVQGTVKNVLSDDNDGSRHQRFILELNSGQTILVAHNIDLADRVSNLNAGDSVQLYGEYEWNERGGVIHWTHHDPNNQHVAGWIEHNNQKFQ